MSWSGSSARNPWAIPVGMTTHSSAPQLACLDARGAARAVEHRAEVDECDEGASLGDDPQVVLALMEVQAAQDARRRGREVGLDEGLVREVARTPQLTERAALIGMPDDRAVADAGQRRRRAALVHARVRASRRSRGA